MNRPRQWLDDARRPAAFAASAFALFLPLAQADAQQAPQPPTAPRAPLGPGSEIQRPTAAGSRRMAPQHDENSPRAGPLALQQQQLTHFRNGLARALNRSTATTPPAKGLLIVNSSDGPFGGVTQLANGEKRRFRLEPFGQTMLPCDPCGERVELLYHDGQARRDVAFPHGSRVYVIVQPIYELFEIISQSETTRLARVTP